MKKIKRSELEALSQQELAALARKLYQVEEAEKRRTLERYFETAHEKQTTFHKDNHRIRLLCGANRSGKSVAGTVEDLWLATGTHPFKKNFRVPSKGLVVLQDYQNHCKNVFEPKLDQWAPTGAIVKKDRNQSGALTKATFSTGSTIDILSHDQEIKVFEGNDYDWAHFDEPPPQRIFNAVWRGLTDRGGIAYITATPLLEPWLYQLYLKAKDGDPLVWVQFMSMMDNVMNLGEGNRVVGEKRIQEFAATLSEEEKAARLEGLFIQMQGLIFKGWDRKHHLIPEFHWPADWPIWESIDPHPQKPWAVAWIGVSENGKKVLLRSGVYEGVIDEVAQQILSERQELQIQHGRKPRIVRCLIDNYASVPLMSRSFTDPTARRRSVREELQALIGPSAGGPPITVAPKNVKMKIDLFKQWLHIRDELGHKDSDFYVFNTVHNERFLDEIENYVWDTKRGGLLAGMKDTPRKEKDDVLDAIMQVCLTMKSNNEEPEIITLPLGNWG